MKQKLRPIQIVSSGKYSPRWTKLLVLVALIIGCVSLWLTWPRTVLDNEKIKISKSTLGAWNFTATAKKANLTTKFSTTPTNTVIQVQRNQANVVLNLPLEEPEIKHQDDQIIYRSKNQKTEIRYQATPTGIKEEIVFHERPLTNTVTATLKLSNVRSDLHNTQSPRFTSLTGEYEFHFAPPFAIDAAGNRTDKVSYQFLIPTPDDSKPQLATKLLPENTYLLVMIIDQQWLHSPDRQYPVIVDPTVIHSSEATVSVVTHDSTKTPDTTPEVRFSSTDPGSGDIVYQVEWDTDSSFPSPQVASSDAQAGFANSDTPADTSPFNSGETVSYTWQSSLSNGTTYFYRVRSKVPAGDNVYGDWSDIRSLTIDTSLDTPVWHQTHSDQFVNGTYDSNVIIDTSNHLIKNELADQYTPITLNNSTGGTLTNHDVLLHLDTATMISQGKLQSDCDDLRFFTDRAFTQNANYWIENGCNTSDTQVWVRLASLATGNSTLYMRYNDPGANQGSQSWTPTNIILPFTSTCPGGWSAVTAMNSSRFPRGSSSYGSTGGNTSHSHTFSGSTGGPSSTYTIYAADGAIDAASSSTHTHSVNITPSNTSYTPPYIDVVFCSYSGIPATAGSTNLRGLFLTTPSGWTYDTDFTERLIRGNSTAGGTGGTETHTHTISGATAQNSQISGGFWCGGDASSTYADTQHTHNVNITSNPTTNFPPFTDFLIMSPNSTDNVLPEGIYVFSDQNSPPPYGWERYSSLDNRFVRGNSVPAGTGGVSNHEHSWSGTTGGNNQNRNCNWSSYNPVGSAGHTHSVSGGSSNTSVLPPYINTVVLRKKIDPVGKTYNSEVSTLTTNYTSSAITLNEIYPYTNWQTLTFTDDETSGDIKYHLYYDNGGTAAIVPDGDLPGNSAGFDTSPVDLSSLSTSQYNTLYIVADITSTMSGTPTIQDWSISAAAAPLSPTDLETSGQTNPTILDVSPTFTGIYREVEEGDDGSAYQIQVATSNTFAEIIWDSTKTAMSSLAKDTRSSGVAYAGPTLNYGTTYYWRLKFWDSHDLEGSWSTENAYFQVFSFTPPTNCAASYNNQTAEIDLSWTDPNTLETAYEIEKEIDGGGFSFLVNLPVDSEAYSDGDVNAGAIYRYRVRAVRNGLTTEWCTSSNVGYSLGTFMIN